MHTHPHLLTGGDASTKVKNPFLFRAREVILKLTEIATNEFISLTECQNIQYMAWMRSLRLEILTDHQIIRNYIKKIQCRLGIFTIGELINELRFPRTDSFNLEIKSTSKYLNKFILDSLLIQDQFAQLQENTIIINKNLFEIANNISTKQLTQRLKSQYAKTINSEKLSELHGFQIENAEAIFNYIHKGIKSSRIKYDVYRILTNKIYTNDILRKMKIKINDKCDNCECTDSLKHRIFDCSEARHVWLFLERFIRSLYGQSINISYNEVICGFRAKDNNLWNGFRFFVLSKLIRLKGKMNEARIKSWLNEFLRLELDSFYTNFKNNKRTKQASRVLSLVQNNHNL